VTAIGDYIFRVCFVDPFQGFVMAKFAKEHLKTTRPAVGDDGLGAAIAPRAEVTGQQEAEERRMAAMRATRCPPGSAPVRQPSISSSHALSLSAQC